MSILFPGGNTCEVYEYGWKSGCTDDQGVTRGVTQGWYFDGGLQAWVSVSNELKDGATGPTGSIAFDEVITSTYSFGTNTSEFTTRTGSLRKFLYLQEDGSITAGYIKFPDLLDPNDEALDITSLTWNSLSSNDYPDSGIYKNVDHTTSGITLCAPSSHVYDFGIYTNDGNLNDDALVTTVLASGTFNLSPAAYGLTLSVDASAGVYTTTYPSLNGDNALPWSSSSPTTGTNTFGEGIGGIILGISAGDGGPAYRLARLVVNATAGPQYQAIATNQKYSSYLGTENLVYFFAATADYYKNEPTNAGITGTNFLEYARGPSGGAFILPSTSSGQNHAIGTDAGGQRLLAADFGNAIAGSYLYICAPARTGIQGGSEGTLYYDFNDATPYGFEKGITSPHQNQYAYTEDYLIFRSANSSGILVQGMLVKGPGNSGTS